MHLLVETSNVLEAQGVLDGLRQFLIPIISTPTAEKTPKFVPPGISLDAKNGQQLLADQLIPLDVVGNPLVCHWMAFATFH